MALDEFLNYVREMSAILHKKAYLKKEMGKEFIPGKVSIGFSDDDVKNVEAVKKHLENKPNKNISTYLTSTGSKKKV